jgi:Na+-driven multidrug efflux pump
MGNYFCKCFGVLGTEAYGLAGLAFPSILMNSLEMMMWAVDVAMLSHLGKGNLAAAAVGWAYFNIVWLFIEGVLTAQDTLISHAVGTCDYKLMRYWLIVSGLVSALLCMIGSFFYCFSYLIIQDIFQIRAHIAVRASLHVVLLIPNLWFLTAFRIMQKFFQTQQINIPILRALVLGNICNALLNYGLMFLTG